MVASNMLIQQPATTSRAAFRSTSWLVRPANSYQTHKYEQELAPLFWKQRANCTELKATVGFVTARSINNSLLKNLTRTLLHLQPNKALVFSFREVKPSVQFQQHLGADLTLALLLLWSVATALMVPSSAEGHTSLFRNFKYHLKPN